jgi:cobalt-zinc-cadmium efflux system outer membrane protein
MIVLGVFLTGCVSVPPKGGFDQVQQAAAQRLGRKVQWNQDTEDDRAITQAVQSLLHRPLTVDDAVQIALLNNRRLQATYEELGVAQANLVQAGLLRNPRFSGSFEPSVSSGPVPVIGLELTQDFLDLFFVGLRKNIAALEFEAAKARVTAAVMDQAGQTRVAFLELQAAEQLLEMRRSVADAAAASVEASRKLFDAGNITQLALANERAGLSQAKLDLAAAQAQTLERRERLNRAMGLWGTDTTAWHMVARLPELPKDEIDVQGIERRAIAQSLDLAEAKARVQVAAGQAGITQWSAMLSELEIGVLSARENDGFWHVGPSVSLQIPIFDQGQARNAAAAAQLRRVLQEYMAEAVEVRSAARAARDRLVAVRERAAYCRDVLLPVRHEVLRESQLQYNAMQIGVFQLLTAKREEIEAGAQYIESLRDYWMARANLELILAGRNTLGTGDATNSSATGASTERKDH